MTTTHTDSEKIEADSFESISVRVHEQLEEVERLIKESKAEEAASVLNQMQAADLSETILSVPHKFRSELLGYITDALLVEALEDMSPEYAAEMVFMLDEERTPLMLDKVSSKTAADILRASDWDKASWVLARMSSRKDLGELLMYADEDAGGIMDISMQVLRAHWSTPYAINVLRMSERGKEDLSHLFALDDENRVVGRLDFPDLVFASPGSTVEDVMRRDFVSVKAGTDQEEAALLARRYHMPNLPVTDDEGRLEGVISAEDLQKVSAQEATEDMYLMAGVQAGDRVVGPIATSIRNRLPWLMTNIVAVSIVAIFLTLFATTLDTISILAVYLPMIMNQAGVAGTQVTTLIVRGLAVGEVSTQNTLRLLGREYMVAGVNGLMVSLAMGVLVGLWRQDVYLGVVIFVAMLISYFVAASGGVLIPLGMKKFKVDPATASGVVLTMFTDMAGGIAYLGLATVFIELLRK